MSLSDKHGRVVRCAAAAVALAALAAASGCQVRPLYSAGIVSFNGNTTTVSSISINEASTRYGQEVRNHLIFLLNGGAGEPANAAYKLDLGVTKRVISSAEVQVGGEGQPSAGAVVLDSNFILTDAATSETVVSGRRSVTASFDRSRQYFSQSRAERDADDRAARELAELVRLAVAGELVKR